MYRADTRSFRAIAPPGLRRQTRSAGGAESVVLEILERQRGAGCAMDGAGSTGGTAGA